MRWLGARYWWEVENGAGIELRFCGRREKLVAQKTGG